MSFLCSDLRWLQYAIWTASLSSFFPHHIDEFFLIEQYWGAVPSLKISPDGRRLASCGDDCVIHVWDLESAELRRTLRRDRPYERLDISGVQGLTDAQRATLRALGAIEEATPPL